jgi:hypothetical protein
VQEAIMSEHKAFFTLIHHNIIKNPPSKRGVSANVSYQNPDEEPEGGAGQVAESKIRDMLDAM